MLADEPRVARRDVADVRREAVTRVERVHPAHRAVADDLGHDRCGGDRGAPLVTVDDRDVLGRGRAEAKTVHQTRFSGRRQRVQRPTQAVQVRAVQTDAIDLTRRDDLDGDARRARKHGPEQLLTILGRDLLRVVQLRQRPNPVVTERVVIEEDAGDDERAGE